MELKNELRGIQNEIYERAGEYLLNSKDLSLSDIEYANSLYKRWLERQFNGFDNSPFVSDPRLYSHKTEGQDKTH